MAVTFTEQFEQALSGQEGVRSSKIANTPLKILIEGSDRKDKNAMVELLTKGDLQNNTLREINENAEIKEKFGRFFEQEGKNKKTAPKADKVLGSFQPFFQEGGYLGPKGNNPARILLQNVIGTKAIQELFPTETIRKVPSPYPFDTYPKLKTVVTNMLSSPDKATRLAGTQLAMHVIGGYRPSDFKNLKIENIDFKSGVVSDLEVKDRGKTTTKQGYFPKIIRDIILKEVDPSGQGLVFPIDNETTINAALKKANILTEYTTAGKVKQGVFTLEDTRKLNETHLTSLGYDEKNPVRLAATLRANKTTIGQYVATGAGGRDIEELFVKTSTPHVAFTGTTNHAQYLSDIGVKPSNIVKRYKVINDVIDRFPLDRVEEFQETYPTLSFSEDNKVITTTLSQVNEGNAKLYQEKSAADLQVEINKANIEAGETAVAAEEGKLKQAEAKKLVKEQAKQATKQQSIDAGNNLFNDIVAEYSVQSDEPSIKKTRQVPITTDTTNPKTGRKYTKKEIAALSAAGIFTVSSSAEAADLAGTVVRDELMELGLGAGLAKVAPELAKNVVGRALPLGAVLAATESSETNMPEVQNMARQNVEQKFFTDPSMTARPIYRDDPRLSDTDMFDQSALPSSNIGLKGRRLETKRRDTATLIPDYDQTKMSNILSGGKPDMQAGFITRPNRSELGDETERQLKSNSFLGAT